MVFNHRRQTEEEEEEGDYMMNIGVRGMLLTEKVAVLSFFLLLLSVACLHLVFQHSAAAASVRIDSIQATA